MITLGKNISALSAIRRIDDASYSLSKSFGRLSSGKRITSASDDPAGLSVSSMLQARSRVLSRGSLNISDGMSLLSIADGAYSQISGLLQRMSELAEQAANGSLSSNQRAALQLEYSQLDQEIRRIGKTTKFNGKGLLESGSPLGGSSNMIHSLTSTTSLVSGGSADGRYFAFTDGLPANQTEIHLYDTVTGIKKQAYQAGPLTAIRNVAMSGSGDIFFVEDAGAGNLSIKKIDRVTGELTTLLNQTHGAGIQGLNVSADGSRIAFLSNADFLPGAQASSGVLANKALYSFNIITGNMEKKIDTGSNSGVNELKISSDGKQIAYREAISRQILKVAGDELISLGDLGNRGRLLGIDSQGYISYLSSTGPDGTGALGPATLYRGQDSASATALFEFFSVDSGMRAGSLSNDGTTISLITGMEATLNSGSGFGAFQFNLLTGKLEHLSSAPGSSVVGFSGDGREFIYRESNRILHQDLSGDSQNIDLEVGFSSKGNIVVQLDALLKAVKGLSGHTLTSVDSAKYALDSLKNNLDLLSQARGTIGAGMSRLESALQLNQGQIAELKAAEGRISDADIGTEAANLVRLNILQQSGVAVLAQANLSPQIVLDLLSFDFL